MFGANDPDEAPDRGVAYGGAAAENIDPLGYAGPDDGADPPCSWNERLCLHLVTPPIQAAAIAIPCRCRGVRRCAPRP